MGDNITWETELASALAKAKSAGKPVFLDFFNPQWIGCQQMDAVTYPEKKVIEFINQHVVPLRVAFDSQPLAADFKVKWTPVLVVLDQEGSAHQQTLGFFAPQELIPSMMLGIAKVHFDRDQYNNALATLHTLQADYPKSAAIPQALYLEGVSRYKQGHEPKTLKEAYEQLQADFPTNEWTQRAYPYRLL